MQGLTLFRAAKVGAVKTASRSQILGNVMVDTSLNGIRQILMDRDGLTYEEATAQLVDLCQQMQDAAASGDQEMMEELLDDYSLECDYAPSLILLEFEK